MNDRAEAPSILRESVVVVFVNSVAGGGRAHFYLAQIQKLFESFQVHAQFVMTGSAAELESSAQNSISHGQRVLFAMGGDGTFQALANAAFGAEALLGVLPVGGGNDFAAALGLPDDPVKAGEAILRGNQRFVDLVRVRTAEGERDCMQVAEVLDLMQRRRATRVVRTDGFPVDFVISRQRYGHWWGTCPSKSVSTFPGPNSFRGKRKRCWQRC